MSVPTNRRASELLAMTLKAEANPQRCGVCDQRSQSPVCRKCEAVLKAERFGSDEELRKELHNER